MAPLNIQMQWTIIEHEEITKKNRLTHDQSFKWKKSGSSVNSQTDTSQLQKCKFGKWLLRLINWAVATWRKYPNQWILAKKDYFKLAYCGLHLHSNTAVKTVTQRPELELALMSLQLTFGGAPGLYKWSVISETVWDLTTAIKHNKKWDTMTLVGKNQHLVPPQNSWMIQPHWRTALRWLLKLSLTHKARPMTTSTTSFLW